MAPRRIARVAAIVLLLFHPLRAAAQVAAAATSTSEAPMTTVARGTFDVKLVPLGSSEAAEGSAIGRMSIDKTFHGDIEGTSVGEMMSAMGSVKGSGTYVALERVTGTVHGKRGTFVLAHQGTMVRGTPTLTVTVVPDSGTGELTGLTGSLNIIIEGSKHSYEFTYSLAGAS